MENEIQEIIYPKGIKWTKQRKHVYQVLLKAKEPLSAAQIYNRVSGAEDDTIYAASTIYRILSVFEKKKLVTRTNWVGEGTAVYELNRGEHTHYAVCLECHKRTPLLHCPFSHLNLEQETKNFIVTGHKLELYGYCRNCNKNL